MRKIVSLVCAIALTAVCLCTGCSVMYGIRSAQTLTSSTITEVNQSQLFQNVYTDKSRYNPGSSVKVYADLENPDAKVPFDGKLEWRVSKNGQKVLTGTVPVSLKAQGSKTIQFQFKLPAQNYVGYAVELYIANKQNKITDVGMTAVDCSSDWKMYPRMGYIAGNMDTRSKEDSRKIINNLRDYHINALYYQDMMDTHDTPLAGTVSQPSSSYYTLAGHRVSRQTLLDMLSVSKENNMATYAYDLMFGAYDDCQLRGVDRNKWGLYKDSHHGEQDAHGPLPDGWETNKLWLMNPANDNWRQHFSKAMLDYTTSYPFDGMIIDTLGRRGGLFDYDGNYVDLQTQYEPFLKYLKVHTNKHLLFNPVDGYGYDETKGLSELDYCFMECWPWTYGTYDSLKGAVDDFYETGKGQKGISLAAYMDYDYAKHGGGEFNAPGVLLTNAAIMAAGGSHMELGDQGMLSTEYYPSDDMLTVTDSLKAQVKNQYSFMTAYEQLLRGPGWEHRKCTTTVNGQDTESSAVTNSVWAYAKVNKSTGIRTIQMINLTDAKSIEWVDNSADQPEPKMISNAKVKHYVDGSISKVMCATPDARQGIMTEVKFTKGKDSGGNYIEFTMPNLKYWTMVVIIP